MDLDVFQAITKWPKYSKCIFVFYIKIREYRKEFESGKFDPHNNPQQPPVNTFNYFMTITAAAALAIEIPMEIGDFVVWNSRLPHSNCPNKSDKWRIQCYVRYMPAALYKDYTEEVETAAVLGYKPAHYSTGQATDGESLEKLHKTFVRPKLSWLGERVCGVTPWVGEKRISVRYNQNDEDLNLLNI